jgi:hypothetical protein
VRHWVLRHEPRRRFDQIFVGRAVWVYSQATFKGAPEETRERAERANAFRGSDQRPSSPKRTLTPPDPRKDVKLRSRSSRLKADAYATRLICGEGWGGVGIGLDTG